MKQLFGTVFLAIITVVSGLAQPAVTAVSPLKHSNDISTDANIVITFSEAMDMATIDTSTIIVTGNFGTIYSGAFSASGNQITFDPSQDFKAGEEVSVMITTGAQDATDNTPLASAYYYGFKTTNNSIGEFKAPVDYTVKGAGNYANYTSVADLNEDGYLDLVIATPLQNVVTVFINNGDGTYGAGTDLATNQSVFELSTVDVDKDGDNDIVTANNAANSLSVFLNNGSGTGTFAARTDYGTLMQSPAKSQVAADMNGDGFVDIIQSNIDSDSLHVFLNDGTGSFNAEKGVATGASVSSLKAVDSDYDNDIDILVVIGTSSLLQEFTNDGSGTLTSGSSWSVGTNPVALATANVNGTTGRVDAMVLALDVNRVDIKFDQFGASYIGTNTTTVGTSPTWITALDVDSDGDQDAVVTNGVGNNLSILSNDGTGVLTESTFSLNSTYGNHITSADVDNDGDLDLITANGNGTFSVVEAYTGPEVASATPLNGTFGNVAASSITLKFNDAINATTLDESSIQVTGSIRGSYSALYSYSSLDSTVTITADSTFLAGELIKVSANGNVESSTGAAMQNPFTFAFMSSAGSGGSYGAGTAYAAGSGADDIVIRDFNADGIEDVATANFTADSISILLGVGDGTFGVATQYYAGNEVTALDAGDVNGDGNLDIVTVANESLVSVFTGTGSGTFSARTTQSISGIGTDITLADLDVDGDLDIIYSSSGSLRRQMNDGTGTFSTEWNLSSSDINVEVVDLNNDGILDAAYVDNNAGISTFKTSSNVGTSTPSTNTYTLNAVAGAVRTGDFNGDGYLDAVVSIAGKIAYYQNNGDGTFAAKVETSLTEYFVADDLQVVDIDGDGDLDVVLANSTNDNFVVLTNDGSASLTETQIISSGDAPKSIALTDVNKDGVTDVLSANYNTGQLSVHLGGVQPAIVSRTPDVYSLSADTSANIEVAFNTSLDPTTVNSTNVTVYGSKTGSIAGSVSYTGGTNTISFDPTNTLNPGEEIIVTLSQAISSTQGLNLEDEVSYSFTVKNYAAEVYLSEATYNLTGSMKSETMATADMDGDGDLDIVNGINWPYAISVAFNDGNGGFGTVDTTTISNTSPYALKVADMDNDGDFDVVITQRVSSNTNILTYSNDGIGGLTLVESFTLTGDLAYGIDVKDIDADGYVDILLAGNSTRNLIKLTNDQDGTFTQSTVNTAFGTTPMRLVAFDVDGDGDMDLVSSDYNDNTISVLKNDGTGTFAARVSYAVTSRPSYLRTGDLNGDGALDLVVSDNDDEAVTVMLNQGNGAFSVSNSFTATVRDIKLFDFDGDEDLDIITRDSQRLMAYPNNGSGAFSSFQEISFGGYMSDFELLDLNDDGALDLVYGESSTIKTALNMPKVEVVSATPAPNALGITVSDNVTITFSKDMDPATLTSSNVHVRSTTSGVIDAVYTYSAGTKTLTINPNTDFKVGEELIITVSTNVTNVDGVKLYQPFISSFSTAASGFGTFVYRDSTDVSAYSSLSIMRGADVDNDGDIDLIANNGSSIEVFKNTAGTYSHSSTIAISSTEKLIIDDIDGDGDVDIVSKPYGDNYLFSNDGTGVFSIADTISTVTFSNYEHILADINSDGYPDIIHLQGSQLMYYKFGAGDFSFPTSGYSTMQHESSGTGFNSDHIAAGDIDNDGDIDILATEKGQSKLLVMTNSLGSFEGTAMYEVGTDPEEIRIADFNGDGFNDVIVMRSDSYAFTVLVNNGDGTFGTANDYGLDANAFLNDVYVKDIDGDNDIDIVIYYENDLTGGQEILFAYNNGSAVFGNQSLFKYPNASPYSYGSFPNDLVFVDVDGDAALDLITHAADYNASGNRVLLTALNEEVIATTPTLAASNISANSTATSSVISWTNGDGNRRLVVLKEASAVDAIPADSANYNPHPVFGSGTQLGTGNYVIYAGAANATAVSGLQAETEYYVEIFEMNGLPGAEKILTASTAVGSFTTAPPPTIWSKNDSTLTFTKANYADATDPANQDKVTETVWFTRGDDRGFYNAAFETSYSSSSSPEGTLWALGTTDDLSTLTFDTFENTLQGAIGDYIEGTDMVVYVEAENLYFDINFSSWSSGGSGGGFSYTRAIGPEPITEVLTYETVAGSALEFDSNTSYAEYVNINTDYVPANFTTEMWVKPSALNTEQVILSYSSDDVLIGINASNQFYASHNQPSVSSGGGGGEEEFPFEAPTSMCCGPGPSNKIETTSSTLATTDAWYHIAVVGETKGLLTLYINGVAEDTVSADILVAEGSAWRLGAHRFNGEDFYGTVDELRIWDVKRTESEIRSFMHRTYEGQQKYLRTYLQFNDGSGSTATDGTGKMDGFINNSNGWVVSEAPIGQGTIEEANDFQTGSTTIGKTTLSMGDGFDNPVDVQVTEISGDPNSFPAGVTSTIGGTYFVINLYGDPGTFSADLTLNYGSGAITPEQAAMPSQIKLFKRSSNSSGSWTDLGGASSANATTGEVTWTGISSFSQFMSVYKEFDLIQTPDTTLISYNDSTLTIPGSFFNFEANYIDTTMTITLDEAIEGTLFIDNNSDNVFNSGDVSITSAQTESYLPSTGSLKYANSLMNTDSLTIRLNAGQFSDSIKVAVATLKANPQLHHTADQNGWFMLSNPTDVTINDWLGSLWTQGAVNSDAPGAGPTLYTFNQDSAFFEPITTDLDTTKLAAGQGLLAYLFADDDFLDGNPPANGGWPKLLPNYGNPFTTDNITVTIKNVDKDNSTTTNGDEGWALMGNPYGWSISVDSLLNTIQRSDASASNFIYRWDTQNGEYVVAGSGQISPYESFFVRLVTSGVTANVELGYDDHVVDAGLKAVNEQKDIPTLAFNLASEGSDKVSKSTVRIMPESMIGADRNDAYYLQPLSAQYSNLFSKVDDLNMVINTVPESLGEMIEIPFYLNTNVGGTFNLSWESSELPDDWKITIVDLQTMQEYDARSEEAIQITKKVKTTTDSDLNSLAKAKASTSEQPVYLVRMEPSTSVSNEEVVDIPDAIELRQNYPNPFNPSTAIQFGVPMAGKVKLEVYDVLGRKVATLINNEFTSAGRHTVTFNARDLASGMYIYRLEVNGKALIQKMTLIK